MTAKQQPFLSRWLLDKVAFGPRRDALIGDLVEQFQLGRSRNWYRQQVLATVVIAATMRIRRTLRMWPASWLFVATGVLLMYARRENAVLLVLIKMFSLIYGSAGIGLLLLTITASHQSQSLLLMDSTPLNQEVV